MYLYSSERVCIAPTNFTPSLENVIDSQPSDPYRIKFLDTALLRRVENQGCAPHHSSVSSTTVDEPLLHEFKDNQS